MGIDTGRLTFKDVGQLCLHHRSVCRRPHDLLPLAHLGIRQQTGIQDSAQTRLVELLADQDNLFSAVAPRLGEVSEDALAGRFVGGPLCWEEMDVSNLARCLERDDKVLGVGGGRVCSLVAATEGEARYRSLGGEREQTVVKGAEPRPASLERQHRAGLAPFAVQRRPGRQPEKALGPQQALEERVVSFILCYDL